MTVCDVENRFIRSSLARLAADAGVRPFDVDESAEPRQLLDDDVTAPAVARTGAVVIKLFCLLMAIYVNKLMCLSLVGLYRLL